MPNSIKTAHVVELNTTISPHDELFAGNSTGDPNDPANAHHYDMYMRCGAEMASYAHDMKPSAANILELPCGFGRVTRHLQTTFPSSAITCVDVLPEAIAFQRNVMRTKAVLIDPPSFVYNALPDDHFDLVVIGALMTHLTQDNNTLLLDQMRSKTRRGGRIIASTRGEAAYLKLIDTPIYQVTEEDRRRMLAAYRSHGYAFAPYAKGHNFEAETADIAGDYYGISLASPLWMMKLGISLGLRLVDFRMGGWDNHLDLLTFEVI